MSELDKYRYGINSTSRDFASLEPWTVDIDDITITWVPGMPYLIGEETPEVDQVIYEINKFINFSEVEEDGSFRLSPVGPVIAGNLSSPYMVRYAIESIYDDTDLVFSETAPQYEPEDMEDEVIPAEKDFNEQDNQPTN